MKRTVEGDNIIITMTKKEAEELKDSMSIVLSGSDNNASMLYFELEDLLKYE
jgi:hypothetical protein